MTMTRAQYQKREKAYGRKLKKLHKAAKETERLRTEVDALYTELYLFTRFDENGDPILLEDA